MGSIPDSELESSETYQALTDIRTVKGVPTLIDDIYERLHEIARLLESNSPARHFSTRIVNLCGPFIIIETATGHFCP
jgi:hypothetical protein